MSLLKLGLAVAAGYSLSRALEAKNAGVALSDAFDLKQLLTPIPRVVRTTTAVVVGSSSTQQQFVQPTSPASPSNAY